MDIRKKKILVTGATGFIGSHLTEICIDLGYNVRAFDRYNPNNDCGWLEQSHYKNDIEVVLGDIRDYDSVYSSMKGCDTVFHLAALIGIPYSYVSPLAYIRTNVEGTYNVLESARQLELENVIVTSTSETYGSAQYVPIDEKHPMVGQSPYSASKIAADQLAISYFRSFDVPIKIVRPFNTYGPRQSARAIVPTVISQLLKANNTVNLGNLRPTRDFTFVKDACSGFIEISKSDKLYGEVTNVGMNEEVTIGELTKKIASLLNVNIKIFEEAKRIRPKGSEVEQLLCDNTKILENTDWSPKYTLKTGLKETISWIKSNIGLYKSENYNI